MYLKDITPYVVTQAHRYIKDMIHKYNPNREEVIDLAGTSLYKGASALIKELRDEGYTFKHSTDDFIQRLLEEKELQLSNVTNIKDAINSLQDMANILKTLDTEHIYTITEAPNNMALAFVSQVYYPNIKWYTPPSVIEKFANYCYNMLFKTKDCFDVNKFYDIMENEDYFCFYTKEHLHVIENFLKK